MYVTMHHNDSTCTIHPMVGVVDPGCHPIHGYRGEGAFEVRRMVDQRHERHTRAESTSGLHGLPSGCMYVRRDNEVFKIRRTIVRVFKYHMVSIDIDSALRANTNILIILLQKGYPGPFVQKSSMIYVYVVCAGRTPGSTRLLRWRFPPSAFF